MDAWKATTARKQKGLSGLSQQHKHHRIWTKFLPKYGKALSLHYAHRIVRALEKSGLNPLNPPQAGGGDTTLLVSTAGM